MRIVIIILISLSALNSVAQTLYTRKSNLPHLYIETYGGKKIVQKDTYILSTMYYVNESDEITEYDSVQIRGRGNSTWNLPKKPYKIKFNEKVKLLGKEKAKAKTWVLLANAGDKTLMRNALTSLAGDFVGLKNNPGHKFVDVTLNGTFLGNYQMTDQVEVRSKRVDIAEQESPVLEGDNVSGGYLLEVDGLRYTNTVKTNFYEVDYCIHYPKEEDIVEEQKEYITNYVNRFEELLSGYNFDDPLCGYRPIIDSVSLANWFIVTELSANVDGYYSTYFYKDKDDPKLYWGPIWDYDIAYANDSRKGDTSSRLMTDVGFGKTKIWINRMWQDPWFGKLVNRRYKELLESGIEQYLYEKIDSLADLLDESQAINYERWGIDTKVLRERVLYTSYTPYVDDLRSFIRAHIPFLKSAFEYKQAVPLVCSFDVSHYWYSITNAKTSSMSLSAEEVVPDSSGVVCSDNFSSVDNSQLWKIIPVDNCYMIINKSSNMALTDPTPGLPSKTATTKNQLEISPINVSDGRQLWVITDVGNGKYNLINKYTLRTLNGKSGSVVGTAITSGVTDNSNTTSTSRLWNISKVSELPEEEWNIKETDYQIELVKGWNWISLPFENISIGRFDNRAERIVGQTHESYYDEALHSMNGDLFSLSSNQMYKFKMTSDAVYKFYDVPFVTDKTINLDCGWNWIGCPIEGVQPLEMTISHDNLEEGDIIISRDGFSVYTQDRGWVGSLTPLSGGKGYMFNSVSGKTVLFEDLDPNVKKQADLKDYNEELQYDVNITAYPNMMGVIALVKCDGFAVESGNYDLFAYCGDECRGYGKMVDGLLFINICGNSGETITFEVKDYDGKHYEIDNEIVFESGVCGTLSEPYIINVTDSEMTDVSSLSNTNPRSVYNLSGIRTDVKDKSSLSPGVYIMRTNGGRSSKIVVQ